MYTFVHMDAHHIYKRTHPRTYAAYTDARTLANTCNHARMQASTIPYPTISFTRNDITFEQVMMQSKPKLKISTCGMIVSLVIRSCRPMSDTLTPSMTIRPSAASMIRKSASVKDDFPAPVRPTTPIYGIRRMVQCNAVQCSAHSHRHSPQLHDSLSQIKKI